jgi:hypothetical protein
MAQDLLNIPADFAGVMAALDAGVLNEPTSCLEIPEMIGDTR